jgi:hypothetical protein
MNEEQYWYQPIVESQQGIVLSNGDGSAIVMDRAARITAHVPGEVGSPSLEELARSQLSELLADADKQDKKYPLRFFVQTSLEALYHSSDVRNALPKLLAGLLRLENPYLLIDFSRPPRDWPLFAHWIYRFLWENKGLYGHIHLRGPFPLLPDEVKDAFHDLGIQLEYTAGWQPDAGADSPEIAHPDALRDLARYGFRIPIRYYVHAGNQGHAAEVVDEGLRLNEYSGFSVPAIFHHPEYDPSASPPPPSAVAYAELLARLYYDFPDYDDIFQPIAELAVLMSEGGWNAQHDVPASIRLMVRPEQGIMIFRQVPAQAVPWIDCASLLSWPMADIVPRLLEFHRQRFAWSKHAFCGRCQWRYVCGGSDAVSVCPHEADAVARAACEYRMLFLEEFARKKAESMSLRLSLPPRQTTSIQGTNGGLYSMADISTLSLSPVQDTKAREDLH